MHKQAWIMAFHSTNNVAHIMASDLKHTLSPFVNDITCYDTVNVFSFLENVIWKTVYRFKSWPLTRTYMYSKKWIVAQMALIVWCVSYTKPKKKERNELLKIWLPIANISHYKCLLNFWHLFMWIDFDIYFFLNFLTVSCWESCWEALVRKEQAYFPCFKMGGNVSLCLHTHFRWTYQLCVCHPWLSI